MSKILLTKKAILRERQKGRELTEIASYVHKFSHGSCDTYFVEEYFECIEILKEALQLWEPSIHENSRKYDTAVKELIEAALGEVNDK